MYYNMIVSGFKKFIIKNINQTRHFETICNSVTFVNGSSGSGKTLSIINKAKDYKNIIL